MEVGNSTEKTTPKHKYPIEYNQWLRVKDFRCRESKSFKIGFLRYYVPAPVARCFIHLMNVDGPVGISVIIKLVLLS